MIMGVNVRVGAEVSVCVAVGVNVGSIVSVGFVVAVKAGKVDVGCPVEGVHAEMNRKINIMILNTFIHTLLKTIK